MGNRATARLMFGSTFDMEPANRDRLARVVWPQFTDKPPHNPDEAGLWELCDKAGFSVCGVGWYDSDTVAVGHTLAYAYNVETVDVATLDVPAEARARVENLCAALGIAEPRVMLVPGYE